MSSTKASVDADQFTQLLQDKSADLQQYLAEGALHSAVRVIQELQEARDQSIYVEIGRLTRTLHESIKDLNLEPLGPLDELSNLSEMADATDRLEHVVKMTERAANKTMDLVEESMPVADKLKQDAETLHQKWERLGQRNMTPAEFRALYKEMGVFLASLSNNSTKLYGNLSDIMVAQDFQDLTGQVIQRVMSLVSEVETSLVRLVKMASSVDTLAGIDHEPEPVKVTKKEEVDPNKGHGPQINAESPDVVSSQDDVDDLLSSLGF